MKRQARKLHEPNVVSFDAQNAGKRFQYIWNALELVEREIDCCHVCNIHACGFKCVHETIWNCKVSQGGRKRCCACGNIALFNIEFLEPLESFQVGWNSSYLLTIVYLDFLAILYVIESFYLLIVFNQNVGTRFIGRNQQGLSTIYKGFATIQRLMFMLFKSTTKATFKTWNKKLLHLKYAIFDFLNDKHELRAFDNTQFKSEISLSWTRIPRKHFGFCLKCF